jgi:two-component system chemotaxis response regulator CheY
MISLDDELAKNYLAESRVHLATVEGDLLALEKSGEAVDEEMINSVFRAVHTIEEGAGLFDLVKIRELAHRAEDILSLIRARKMVPTPARVGVLLRAVDMLGEMLRNPGTSNQADNSGIVAALDRLRAEDPSPEVDNSSALAAGPEPRDTPPLRVLLVEDDFASRLLLQTFLSRYGECHVAVNGREAVEAFRAASERGEPYSLICMDIMMPELDGREAVRQVRAMEESRGVQSTEGAKIVMTTTLRDIKEVSQCYWELCDAYLTKPIDLGELLSKMKSFHLVR